MQAASVECANCWFQRLSELIQQADDASARLAHITPTLRQQQRNEAAAAAAINDGDGKSLDSVSLHSAESAGALQAGFAAVVVDDYSDGAVHLRRGQIVDVIERNDTGNSFVVRVSLGAAGVVSDSKPPQSSNNRHSYASGTADAVAADQQRSPTRSTSCSSIGLGEPTSSLLVAIPARCLAATSPSSSTTTLTSSASTTVAAAAASNDISDDVSAAANQRHRVVPLARRRVDGSSNFRKWQQRLMTPLRRLSASSETSRVNEEVSSVVAGAGQTSVVGVSRTSAFDRTTTGAINDGDDVFAPVAHGARAVKSTRGGNNRHSLMSVGSDNSTSATTISDELELPPPMPQISVSSSSPSRTVDENAPALIESSSSNDDCRNATKNGGSVAALSVTVDRVSLSNGGGHELKSSAAGAHQNGGGSLNHERPSSQRSLPSISTSSGT